MNGHNKGQAVAMDIMLVCICISVFAVGTWVFALNGKAPSSEAQRSRQDYVKSLLVSSLYATPATDDPRYATKSLSDLIAMRMANPDKVSEDMLISKIKDSKLNENLKDKVIGRDAEWFLYSEYSTYDTDKKICFHGGSGTDTIESCPADKVQAEVSSSANADIVCPFKVFTKVPVFLIIKWS